MEASNLFNSRIFKREKNITKVFPLISHVLNTAPIESDALANLSGALGMYGYAKEVINIILPHYNPECGESPGLVSNILQSYTETKMAEQGLSFIDKVRSSLKSSDPGGRVKDLHLNEMLISYEKDFINMLG